MWAKADEDALPQYSTNNVVAYPQDPDATVQMICLLPEDLCESLTVQVVGDDPEAVCRDPALVVNLHHLRAALFWLVTHCWPWLQATKNQGQNLHDNLGPVLESVIDKYRTRLKGKIAGVPAELQVAATTRSSSRLAGVNLGPADCVPQHNDGEEDLQEEAFCTHRAATDSSCAVIGEGEHKITPFQLWSVAMKKYKVFEECETTFNTAGAEESEKAQALRDETCAIGQAIHAVHDLASKEIRQQLRAFVSQDIGF